MMAAKELAGGSFQAIIQDERARIAHTALVAERLDQGPPPDQEGVRREAERRRVDVRFAASIRLANSA